MGYYHTIDTIELYCNCEKFLLVPRGCQATTDLPFVIID